MKFEKQDKKYYDKIRAKTKKAHKRVRYVENFDGALLDNTLKEWTRATNELIREMEKQKIIREFKSKDKQQRNIGCQQNTTN